VPVVQSDSMDPITQGVAGNAIWTAVMAAGRSIFPHKIKIISPRPQELLGGRGGLSQGNEDTDGNKTPLFAFQSFTSPYARKDGVHCDIRESRTKCVVLDQLTHTCCSFRAAKFGEQLKSTLSEFFHILVCLQSWSRTHTFSLSICSRCGK